MFLYMLEQKANTNIDSWRTIRLGGSIYNHYCGIQVNAWCWRAAHLGGNLNNGANSGPFNLNFNNSAANRNANIGAQLYLYIKNIARSVFRGSCQNIKK